MANDRKTKENNQSISKFLETLSDPLQREESYKLINLLNKLTDSSPTMWGKSIIGFGKFNYETKTKNQNEWFVIGFSPRKNSFSVYFMDGFDDKMELLKVLGKHKTGKCCLYIRTLNDVDMNILTKLLKRSVMNVKNRE